MSDYIKVKTTDHQTVYLRKDSISGIEPVAGGARTSEHIRVFSGGYKWLVEESHESFFKKMGIEYDSETSPLES